MIWTLAFWKGAAERGVKTFCQSFLAAVGVGFVGGIQQIAWTDDLSIAAAATVLSLITSIGNASFTAGATAQADAASLIAANSVTIPVPVADPDAIESAAPGGTPTPPVG